MQPPPPPGQPVPPGFAPTPAAPQYTDPMHAPGPAVGHPSAAGFNGAMPPGAAAPAQGTYPAPPPPPGQPVPTGATAPAPGAATPPVAAGAQYQPPIQPAYATTSQPQQAPQYAAPAPASPTAVAPMAHQAPAYQAPAAAGTYQAPAPGAYQAPATTAAPPMAAAPPMGAAPMAESPTVAAPMATLPGTATPVPTVTALSSQSQSPDLASPPPTMGYASPSTGQYHQYPAAPAAGPTGTPPPAPTTQAYPAAMPMQTPAATLQTHSQGSTHAPGQVHQQQYPAQAGQQAMMPGQQPQTPVDSPNREPRPQSTPTQHGTQGNSSFAGKSPAPGGARRARPKKTPNKIESSQVPTPAREHPTESPQNPRPVFSTNKGIPPLAQLGFTAVDEGNASPKFIRPTMHAAPHEERFLKNSGMSWAVVLAPLQDNFDPNEAPPPVVSGRQPIRCPRCRAYMNPHSPFLELGKVWECVFCGMKSDVPSEMFCNLDSNSKRRDANENPEFGCGSMEYDVTGVEEYAMRGSNGQVVNAKPMQHLIAVDVSKAAASHLPTLIDGLRVSLRQMAARYPTCKVSFVTFAETLHFYNFSNPAMPQLVVPDVASPFVPLPFTLLCWMTVGEQLEQIEEFLDRVLTLPEIMEEDGCCAGAVAKVATLILSEGGGKLVMSISREPNCGVGEVKPRETHKIYGTDQEKQLFKPADGFWPATAVELAKKAVSVDILAFPMKHAEIVTPGQACMLTGGNQTLFVNFDPTHAGHRVHNALMKSLVEAGGYGAILRLRCSQGIRVAQYHGHYLSQDAQDMDLAGVQSSSTFVADLQHESSLDPKSYAFLQCGVLYTTRCGHRRIRVHTLRCAIANTYSSLFRSADLESHTQTLVYHGVREAMNRGSKAAREWLTTRIVEVLYSYRRTCSQSSHSGQLLLPEQLKLMPLYILCAMKSNALTIGTGVSVDMRVQSMFDLTTMPLHLTLPFLYPRLHALQALMTLPHAGYLKSELSSQCYMPPQQQLTTDTIMCHGVYALHDQQDNQVFLWLGSAVVPRVTSALFGVEDISQVELANFENWNERLRNVLSQMMREGNSRLVVVKEKVDVLEDSFFSNMFEDDDAPVQGGQGYSDFLCYLHKTINAKLH